MPEAPDVGALTLAVGEMRGQLREMIHAQNNIAQKVDFLTERALLAPTTAQIEALTKRIDALEAERDRRDGATSMGAAVLKSPIVGWLVGGAVTVWALLKGGSA